jgi:hypothetical protein
MAYSFLEEIRDKCIPLIKRLNMETEKPNTSELQLKLVEYHRKYINPASVSAIYAAQKDVDNVKQTMKTNMNKFLLVNEQMEVKL